MTYADAYDCDDITAKEALRKLRRHGVLADLIDDRIVDCETNEVIARANEYGEFTGGDILDYLGY